MTRSRAREFAPELIITDIQLPHISGEQLIRLFRSDPGLERVPIMAVTAYAGVGDDERIRAAGANSYVSKPISVVKFIKAVEALLTGEPAVEEPVRAAPAEEPWRPEPAREQPDEWQGTGGLDSWSPAPDTGDTWKGAGTTEPWAEPAAQPWPEQPSAPSYGGDRYDDELSPRPSSAIPADQGGIGSGSGNTWAFDRDDPRLPDVVRDAERRRRESAPEGPEFTDWGADPLGEAPAERPTDVSVEGEGGPDTGTLSAAVAGSDDPLAAIADMQSRARAKETQEYGDELGPEQGWDDRSWDEPAQDGAVREQRAATVWDETPEEGDDSWRGGEGATQMFTAPSFDQGPEPGGQGYGQQGHEGRGYDELGFDDRGPARTESGYDELGLDDRGRAEPGYGGPGYDELDGRAPAAPGTPSDLGQAPAPAFGADPVGGGYPEPGYSGGYPEDQYAINLLKAGASGFVAKDAPPENLVSAVVAAAQGWQSHLTKRVTTEELSPDATCRPDGSGLASGSAVVRLRTVYDLPFQTWDVTPAGAEARMEPPIS